MPFHINSKADTVFLGDTSVTSLYRDQSQFHTDLEDQGTYYDSNDDRFAITSPRELTVIVQLTNTDSGVILYYGTDSGASFTYRLQLTAGSIQCRHNSSGSPIITLAPPNLGVSERSYLIQWSTCPEYVTNQHLSELSICDLATGTWALARNIHSAPTANLAHSFAVAATGNGSLPFSGTVADITCVRVGRRFHSSQEAHQDWVSLTSAPATAGLYLPPENCPHLNDPYSVANAEDVGEALANNYAFAGPALWLGNIQGRKNRLRLYSPIVNQGSPNPVTLDRFFDPSSRFVTAPDGLYTLSIYHFWRRPLPKGCTALKARVHAQTWLEMGAPGGSVVSIGLKAFSMTKLPHQAGMEWSASSSVTLSTNHGASGTGEWCDLGLLPVRIISGTADLSYLAIAFRINSVTGADYNRLKIKHVQIEPLAGEDF
ncbi:hypothetical protein [Nannocystis sp. SCPEA4]|uniref:hypothetical protein n=1 Tax=Nannocystis sp. SCPEA4 TaxID=2996787 RepID=UPI0022707881|nr:hypothetical protein [Nannocystis sp. SCPEA4]MCY1055443.1 hypothetical protein [Nannocystis sp. SCPEA4]